MSEQTDALGNPIKKLRGFALMTKEAHRLSASKGGITAQARGKAHRFTTESAKVAGSKGGKGRHAHEVVANPAKPANYKRKKGKYNERTPEELAKRYVETETLAPREKDVGRPVIELEVMTEEDALRVGEVGPEDFDCLAGSGKATLKELLVPENAELLNQTMLEVGEEMMAKGEPKITYQSDEKVNDWTAGISSGPIDLQLTPEQEQLLAELKGSADEDRDL